MTIVPTKDYSMLAGLSLFLFSFFSSFPPWPYSPSLSVKTKNTQTWHRPPYLDLLWPTLHSIPRPPFSLSHQRSLGLFIDEGYIKREENDQEEEERRHGRKRMHRPDRKTTVRGAVPRRILWLARANVVFRLSWVW